MKRRRLFLIASLLLAVALIAFLLWPREREPKYQSHPLSFWLAKTKADGTNGAAADAIRAIGTNGLPLLTKWLGYEAIPLDWYILTNHITPRPLRAPLCKFVFGSYNPVQRRGMAVTGFQLLGPQASPAIPEIIDLCLIHGKDDFDIYAIGSLNFIGTNSLPHIATVLTNETYTDKIRARTALWLSMLDQRDHSSVPNLVRCVQKGDGAVARQAARALSQWHAEPDVVLPFLIKLAKDPNPVTRIDACGYIANYAGGARSALPTITDLFNDPSEKVRIAATNAVHNIAPDPPP